MLTLVRSAIMQKKILNIFKWVLCFASTMVICTANADNDKNLSSGAILKITQQPSFTSVKFNTYNSLTFVIHNNSSVPVPLNPTTINYTPNSNQLINPMLVNNCNNLVPANSDCTFTYSFTTGSTFSNTSIVVNFNYDRRQIPLVTNAFTLVVDSAGEALNISPQPDSVTVPFNSSGSVTFGVQNTSPTAITLGTTTISVVTPNVISNTSLTSPCGSIIPGNQTCTFTFSFTSGGSIANTDVNITFNYPGNTLPVNPFNINVDNAVPPSTARVITMTNNCNQTIWFGITGGAVRSQIAPPGCTGAACTTCSTTADCFTGSLCFNGTCYSNTPVPNGNDYSLTTGQSKTVSIPIPDPSIDIGPQDIFWSGAIGARTGCAFNGANIFVCNTGTCDNSTTPGTQACTTGVGMTPPNTLAEITMLRSGVDSYDISLINGVNVPTSFGPTTTPVDSSNPFICGTAGQTQTVVTSGGTLAGCNWELAPPSIDYVFVSDAGGTCASNSDCPGQVCGLSLATITGGTHIATTTCGNFLGWWTADQVCGLDPLMGTPFNCNSIMFHMIPPIRLTKLLQCAPPIPSCYDTSQPKENNICCGCINWSNTGTFPVETCYNTSQDWTTNVQPNLQWLKNACPTIYTYPYDDASSSFTCNTPDTDDTPPINVTDYTVTFCPA